MPALPSPVIFVPGIKGSALRDEYPVSPETVWSVAQAALKSYDRITLHPYDLRYELQEPARIGQDGVFKLFYGELIEELRHNLTEKPSAPVPVFPFAYDWRMPLAETQARLADFIEEVVARTSLLPHYNADDYRLDNGRVHLVGHSMGGLVIAGLVATGAQDAVDRVDKIATIATPFRGSLEAVALTVTGDSTLTSGGAREREAARLTPALYHLLPSFKEAFGPDSSSAWTLYQALNWQRSVIQTIGTFVEQYRLEKGPQPAPMELLDQMLDDAFKHRSSIGAGIQAKLGDTRRWLCVVGLDSPTRVSMRIGPDTTGFRFAIGGETNEYRSDDVAARVQTGDGTVPYLGACPEFLPRQQLVCVTEKEYGFWEWKDRVLNRVGLHANLPNMNVVQRLVTSHLLGRQYGELTGRPGPDVDPGAWDPPIARGDISLATS